MSLNEKSSSSSALRLCLVTVEEGWGSLSREEAGLEAPSATEQAIAAEASPDNEPEDETNVMMPEGPHAVPGGELTLQTLSSAICHSPI